MKRVLLWVAAPFLLVGCVGTGSLGASGINDDLLEPLTGGVISTVDASALSPLSSRARQDAVIAEFRALQSPIGAAPQAWADDRARISGQVQAGLPYRVGMQDCRPLTQTVTVSGQVKTATGAACRESDGRWVRVG